MRASPAPGQLSATSDRSGLLTSWQILPALCKRKRSCWEGWELRRDMTTGFCFTAGGILAARAEEIGQRGRHHPGAQQ